jgi:hypothetical protein
MSYRAPTAIRDFLFHIAARHGRARAAIGAGLRIAVHPLSLAYVQRTSIMK